jgi:hypothetical protein
MNDATARARFLIVNADDFGLSEGVNRGIIEAHERGIVTSASLMVRNRPPRGGAIRANQPRLSVGLHVDLGEWTVGDDGKVELPLRGRRTPKTRRSSGARSRSSRASASSSAATRRTSIRTSTRTRTSPRARSSWAPRSRCAFPCVTSAAASVLRRFLWPGSGASRARAHHARALIEVLAGLKAGITELACHPATM